MGAFVLYWVSFFVGEIGDDEDASILYRRRICLGMSAPYHGVHCPQCSINKGRWLEYRAALCPHKDRIRDARLLQHR